MSLWNILRNNIGKDLSKVSMPVQLNEPLNTLQRLCEELEYSSLLDQASRMTDPCERMVSTQGRLFLLRFCLSFCLPSQVPAGWVPDAGALHQNPRLGLRQAAVPHPRAALYP